MAIHRGQNLTADSLIPIGVFSGLLLVIAAVLVMSTNAAEEGKQIALTLALGSAVVALPAIVVNPFIGLVAMVLAESTRRFIVVPGIGELGTAIGMVTLVAVALQLRRRKGLLNPGLKSSVWKWLVAFVAVGALSITVAPHPDVSFEEFRRMLFRFIPFFLLLSSQLRTMKKFRILAWAFMVTGVYWCVESSFRYQYYVQDFDQRYVFAKGRGTAEAIVALAIPLALGLLWQEQNRRRRILLVGLLVAFAFSVGIASARAALVSLLVVVVYVSVRKYRLSPRAWVPAVLVAFAVFWFLPESLLQKRYSAVIERGAQSRTVGVRLNMWYAGVALIRDHPVLGVGLGNSKFVLPKYASTHQLKGIPAKGRATYLHQAYLDVAVQMGILGLAAYLGILITCFRTLGRIRRIAHLERSREIEGFALAFQAGLIAVVCQGFFGRAWDGDGLWFLLGMTAALEYLARKITSAPTEFLPAHRNPGLAENGFPRGSTEEGVERR